MSFRYIILLFSCLFLFLVILFSLVSIVVHNLLLHGCSSWNLVLSEWLPNKNTAAFWCNFPTSKVIHAAYEYESALRTLFLQYAGVLSAQILRSLARNPLGKWGMTTTCVWNKLSLLLYCKPSVFSSFFLQHSFDLAIHFEMFCLQPQKGSDTSQFQADLLTEPWSTTWTAHSSSSSCQRSWCERVPERTRTRVRALLRDRQLARTGQWRILLL